MQATLPTNMQPTYLHASQVHASICVAKFQARFHNPHPGRRSYIRPKTGSNWSIGRMIWNPEGSQWYEEAPCKAVKACLCSSLGVTPMIRNPEGSQWYEEAPCNAARSLSLSISLTGASPPARMPLRPVQDAALATIGHVPSLSRACDIVAYSSLTKRPYLCLSHHFLYILYIA
jgi:hypothetical protein